MTDARTREEADRIIGRYPYEVGQLIRDLLAHGEADASELEDLRAFVARKGYRRCDIPACNCNSWHYGNAEARLREIEDTLENAGVRMNSTTSLTAVQQLTQQREDDAQRIAALEKRNQADWDHVLATVDGLSRRAIQAEQERDALRAYVQHKPRCEALFCRQHGGDGSISGCPRCQGIPTVRACTCGLDALLSGSHPTPAPTREQA